MIIQNLQKLVDNGEQLYARICTVHRVDKTNKCCDVMPVDGSAELFEVPFHPSEAELGLCLYPTEGSHVLVVFINKHHACICQMSELEMMQLKIDHVQFSIDKEGFLLKKENESLKKLMTDLLEAIQAMVFMTSQGPTTQLMNAGAFKAIQTRFNSFLKD